MFGLSLQFQAAAASSASAAILGTAREFGTVVMALAMVAVLAPSVLKVLHRRICASTA